MFYSPQNPNKNLSDTRFTKISFKIFENFSNFVVRLTLFCSFNRTEMTEKMTEKMSENPNVAKMGSKSDMCFMASN